MVASQGLHNTLKLPDKGKVAQICNFFGGWSTWCSSFGVWFGILVELSSPFQRVRTNKVYYWLLGHAYFVKIAADIFFYWKVPGYQVPVRSGGETRKISEGRSCCALDRYVPFFSLTFWSHSARWHQACMFTCICCPQHILTGFLRVGNNRCVSSRINAVASLARTLSS